MPPAASVAMAGAGPRPSTPGGGESRAVLLVAGRDPRDEVSGGHSAYVRSYARAACLAGYAPHLFCAARDSRIEAEPYGTVHRVASPARPFRQVAAGFHAPWLCRAMLRFAAAQAAAATPRAPILLHGFGVWSYAAVLAARRLAAMDIAAVAVASSYTTYEEEARAGVRAVSAYGVGRRLRAHAEHLWIRWVAERWERRGYLAADRVLVNYDSVRRLVEAKYGAAVRCQRLPYTCESAFDPQLPRRSPAVPAAGPPGAPPAEIAALAPLAAPLILAVSRNLPRKGVDVLLHSLARLRAGGVALRACLVGGGPLLDEHRRLAAALGLAGSVVLAGAVAAVEPFLAHAALFVLPSREEQSGSLALLEALRAGLPVVASAVDGIPEDVRDGEDALLVPPGDPAALAAALGRLLDDSQLRRRLGERGRQTFADRFAAPVVAAALRRLYQDLEVAR